MDLSTGPAVAGVVREGVGVTKEDVVEGFTDEDTSSGLTEVVDVLGGLTEWDEFEVKDAQSPSWHEYPDGHLEQLLPFSYIDAPLKLPASA